MTDFAGDPPVTKQTAASRDGASLNSAEVRHRLRTVSRESYLLLYSLMKSVSVAAFAYGVAQYAAGEDSDWWPRAAFWAASFCGVILTYHAALVGSVIHELRFSVADSALPLLLCAVETLLFFVLADSPSSDQTPTAWYLAFAVWAVIASGIIWRVRREIQHQSQTGTEDVRNASVDYVARLTTDGRIAGGVAFAAASVWALRSIGALDWLGGWEAAIGVGALVVLIGALFSQEQALEEIRRAVHP